MTYMKHPGEVNPVTGCGLAFPGAVGKGGNGGNCLMGAGFPQSGNNLLELEAVAAQHSEGIKCH